MAKLTDNMLWTLHYIAEYGDRTVTYHGYGTTSTAPALRIHNGNPPDGAATFEEAGTHAWISFSSAKALARRGLVTLKEDHPRDAKITALGRSVHDELWPAFDRRQTDELVQGLDN